MAMALAGFITLGGPLEKSYADQIHVAKQEGTVPEFVLEAGITEQKLDAFEKKLKEEEPEFWGWFEYYEESVVKELDGYKNRVLSISSEQDTGAEQILMRETENSSMDETKKEGTRHKIEEYIDLDHKIVASLKNKPEALEEHIKFLQNNIRTIILGSLFLDDSREVRDNLARFNDPPKIFFMPHSAQELFGVRGSHHALYPDPANTEETNFKHYILMAPTAFMDMGLNINLNYHDSILIHELLHSLTISVSPESFSSGSEMLLTVGEGITQNKTLEIIQFLNQKNINLKPILGLYDERVVYAAILRGIAKTYENGDLLSKWQSGLIDDEVFLDHFKKAAIDLNLSGDSIVKNIRTLKKTETDLALVNLIERLQLDYVDLSPEFVNDILTQGRSIDDQAGTKGLSKNIKDMLEWIYVETHVNRERFTQQLTQKK